MSIAAGGCAIFSFEWDGSTTLYFARGNGGSAGGLTAGDGTSSTFSYGGSTLAIARGGDAGVNYNGTGTASGGTASVYTSVTTLLGYYTRTGGSSSVTSIGQASAGGGVDFFGAGVASVTGAYASRSGGNPWGFYSTLDYVYDPTESRTIMGLPAGFSHGVLKPNGATIGIQGGHRGYGGTTDSPGYAGDGGLFCGGGSSYGGESAYAGDGGIGGGGGGCRADSGRAGGTGGIGALFWSKL